MHRGRRGTAVLVVTDAGLVVGANAAAGVLLGVHVHDDINSVLRPPAPLEALLREQLSCVLTSTAGRLIDCEALKVGAQLVISCRAADDRLTDEHSELMLDATPRGLYEWDVGLDELTWSSGLPNVLTGPGLGGSTWRAQIHPEDEPRVRQSLETALAQRQERWSQQYRFRRADGGYLWLEDSALLRYSPDGAPQRRVGVLEDISEDRHLRERLALAERLAAVGTLAAGVAHEINNPLAWITANINFALEELERVRSETPVVMLVDEAIAALRDVRSGAERVGLIVRDLKTFARADDERVGPVDVVRTIESAITMAGSEIRPRARLVRQLHPVPPIEGNEGRLSQVLLNLLVNAAQSLPEGAARTNEIVVSTSLDREGRVVVELKDTGVGIPPEVLPRIFDPFFSTKPVGQGTGLGLSICHALVTQMGGTLGVSSEVGKGSVFTLTLPVAKVRSEADAARLRGRVMVIDGEPAITTMMRRVLSAQHEVHAFKHATAAEAELMALDPDIIFCDLVLPGFQPAAFLARLGPAFRRRVVFMTGGAMSAEALELQREGVVVLEKPFSIDRVRQLVAQRVSSR